MSDINTINYEPLEADTHAYSIIFKRHLIPSILIFAVAAGLCFVAFTLGVGVVILWLFYIAAQVRALKNQVWANFATANGWQLNMDLAPAALVPPSLMFGHSQTYSLVITAQLGEIAADMFAYTTTVGYGKSQHTYSFSIARVMLPTNLPHMMLRAKKGVSSEVQQDFADLETLQLEGDFDDYFKLQIDKGQEINALEILTPDVMQTLVSYSQREDIEIVGGALFFMVNGDARTPVATQGLIQSLAELCGQIIEHVRLTTVSAPVEAVPTPTPAVAPAPPVPIDPATPTPPAA